MPMSNYLTIPSILPFKFVPSTRNYGYHFDDSWACEQIKWYEQKALYLQKWELADTTPLQIESTFVPQPLLVYDSEANIAKTINWTAVSVGVNHGVYECLFSVSELPEGIYCLVIRGLADAQAFEFISHPISVRTKWYDTLLFTYRNTFNAHGVAFSSGIEFNFRCEASIGEYVPKRDRVVYVNQKRSVTTVSGTPYRQFKLFIGESRADLGVFPYILDILNRIFVCDRIKIEGKYYQSSEESEWDIPNRVRQRPLITASIDIVDSQDGVTITDATMAAGSVIAAYNIETSFFGTSNLVPITDIEQQD